MGGLDFTSSRGAINNGDKETQGLEFEGNMSWTMYPNPTAGTLFISSSNVQINSVEIYDLSGRSVREFTLNAMEANIQLPELPASVYFVKIETDMGSSIKRLVKQ